MCGRYTNLLSWSEMVELYGVTRTAAPLNLAQRYNIAPTQDIAIVRPADGGRELALLRWGLIPSWAKEAAIGARLINARIETLAEKPAFRSALVRRRCLVPADGFYEWKAAPGGRQPYRITLADGKPFAFAGLWERWEKAPGGEPVESCAIVTTAANEFLRPIHGRMPAILESAGYEAWLDVRGTSPLRAVSLLMPYAGPMEALAVSRRVNSPRNDDPACIERAS